MSFVIWQGYELKNQRRYAASTKKALLDKIAKRCPDPIIMREFNVWKSTFTPCAEWIHGCIEAMSNHAESEKNLTKLLDREFLTPVESSRCVGFFARNKCMDIMSRPGKEPELVSGETTENGEANE